MDPEAKMSQKFIVFSIAVLSFVLLSGCGGHCSPNQIESYPPPIPLEPANYEITNGDPIFRLNYGLSVHACFHAYTLIYSEDPDFNTTTTLSGDPFDEEIDQNLGLDPGRQYWWKLAASLSDGTVGPYSEAMTFIVGPECTNSGELDVPIQLYPFDGSSVNSEFPVIAYETPGDCAQKYWVDLQTDPNFGGMNLLQSSTPFLSTRISPAEAFALADCTTYYWRVWTTIKGVDSPYSPTWSFTTDFTGNCGSPSPTTPPTEIPTPAPTLIPIPTNTPIPSATPVDCSIYTNEKKCEVHPECVWDTSTRLAVCKNK